MKKNICPSVFSISVSVSVVILRGRPCSFPFSSKIPPSILLLLASCYSPGSVKKASFHDPHLVWCGHAGVIFCPVGLWAGSWPSVITMSGQVVDSDTVGV
ncbi:hypothetical protein AVEN_182439-1 [Araneus ventricosus]|uniref:Uncharacterized protein n=1 Tax=Araneus ventricosus TaxID=182803 RepID=A0A4Y1ZPX1_ARAVE|nr:hypothetical protein AVEN_182439-1 [Araneus ventricosus]